MMRSPMSRKNIVVNVLFDEEAFRAMEALRSQKGVSRSALFRDLAVEGLKVDQKKSDVSPAPCAFDQFLIEIEQS